MTRTPPAFGTPATRLHAGRILLVLALIVGAGIAAWIWVFHKGTKVSTVATESSTNPGWTASQLHYEKPEVKAEVPAPKPVDMTAAELAKLRAMLAQMQAEIDALKTANLPPPRPLSSNHPSPSRPRRSQGPCCSCTTM